jgi:hypothetical protein
MAEEVSDLERARLRAGRALARLERTEDGGWLLREAMLREWHERHSDLCGAMGRLEVEELKARGDEWAARHCAGMLGAVSAPSVPRKASVAGFCEVLDGDGGICFCADCELR